MKEMTTSEFQKATLSELTEPVTIRRYKKVEGVYYPASFDAFEQVSDVPSVPVVPDVPAADTGRITELEEEVSRLKRELAARPKATLATPPPATPLGRSSDPFADLAKQDREFFERKMGGKKK